jgi:hypothetical protein
MEKRRVLEREEKRVYWEQMLYKWEASGLSQSEFCRQNDLNRRRFNYWKRRFRKSSQSIPLVQLGGLACFSEKYLSNSTALGLTIDGRFRIEICDGFNPVTLEQVIQIICRQ